MQVTKEDLAVFVYTLAVILSTAWVINTFPTESTAVEVGFGLILATVWTVYFRWDVATRLNTVDHPAEESG